MGAVSIPPPFAVITTAFQFPEKDLIQSLIHLFPISLFPRVAHSYAPQAARILESGDTEADGRGKAGIRRAGVVGTASVGDIAPIRGIP